jgi:hypothetical protein
MLLMRELGLEQLGLLRQFHQEAPIRLRVHGRYPPYFNAIIGLVRAWSKTSAAVLNPALNPALGSWSRTLA